MSRINFEQNSHMGPVFSRLDPAHSNPFYQRIMDTGDQSSDFMRVARELIVSKQVMRSIIGPEGQRLHLKPIREEYGVIDLGNIDELIQHYRDEAKVLKAERKHWIERARMAGYDTSQYLAKKAKKTQSVSGKSLPEKNNGHSNGNGNDHNQEDLTQYKKIATATEKEKVLVGTSR